MTFKGRLLLAPLFFGGKFLRVCDLSLVLSVIHTDVIMSYSQQ